MTDTEAAWLAGILDGEGSMMITTDRKRAHLTSYDVVVAVTNTDRAMVEECQRIAGGCTYGPVARKNAKWRDAYRWNVKCRQAEGVLRQTLPYLVCKRRQAELCLASRLLVRRGARRGELGRQANTPEEVAEKEALKAAVQALNLRRGYDSPEMAAVAEAAIRLVSGIGQAPAAAP